MRFPLGVPGLLALLALAGCMKVSDMAEGTRYHLRDAGILDHSETRRASSWRLQPDSFIYIAQGHFVPRVMSIRGRMSWRRRPSTASSNISRWCAALASRPGWRKP